MSKDTPTPAALREAVAKYIESEIVGAIFISGPRLMEHADRILALLPLDPGEAPAPAPAPKGEA